jgi:serine/threonine-protein kinase
MQACDALGAIHRAGGVHRDVKSSNIMVDADGNMTLLDFGILRGLSAVGGTMTQTGNIVGTPHYMSPEQVRSSKDLDHRSDLYSLGIVMYEVFTGRLPFLAKNVFDILSMHANQPPESPLAVNSMLPEAVADVILRAIEKDRDERYQSAGELKEALAGAVPETGRWQSFSTGVFKAPPTNEHAKVVLSRSLLGTAGALGPTEAAGETQVAPGAALVPPTATGLSGFYGESQLQLTRRRRRQWVGASVVAAVVVAGGVLFALKGDDRAVKPAAAPKEVESSQSGVESLQRTSPAPAPATAPEGADSPRRHGVTEKEIFPRIAPAHAPALPSYRPPSVSPRLRGESSPPATARARAEKRPRDTEPATLNVGVVEGDEPSSGVLLVDGKRHGEVPGSFQLAPGKYRLAIEKKNYRSFPRTVKLKPGKEQAVTFKVERVEP